jgi:hypothetical protein
MSTRRQSHTLAARINSTQCAAMGTLFFSIFFSGAQTYIHTQIDMNMFQVPIATCR